jgi:hypothetical protein
MRNEFAAKPLSTAPLALSPLALKPLILSYFFLSVGHKGLTMYTPSPVPVIATLCILTSLVTASPDVNPSVTHTLPTDHTVSHGESHYLVSVSSSSTTSPPTTAPDNEHARTNITCDISTNDPSLSMLVTVVTGVVGLLGGAVSATVVTHRMMNSVCIKGNATISGEGSVIRITTGIDHDTAPTTNTAKTSGLLRLVSKLKSLLFKTKTAPPDTLV